MAQSSSRKPGGSPAPPDRRRMAHQRDVAAGAQCVPQCRRGSWRRAARRARRRDGRRMKPPRDPPPAIYGDVRSVRQSVRVRSALDQIAYLARRASACRDKRSSDAGRRTGRTDSRARQQSCRLRAAHPHQHVLDRARGGGELVRVARAQHHVGVGPALRNRRTDSCRSRPRDWPWRSRRAGCRCRLRAHRRARSPTACGRRS